MKIILTTTSELDDEEVAYLSAFNDVDRVAALDQVKEEFLNNIKGEFSKPDSVTMDLKIIE